MFKKKVNFLLIILAAFLFASCSQAPTKSEDQYLTEAKALYDAKKYDEAINMYKEMIQKYPQSPKSITAYNQLAGIYIENKNDYNSAIQAYKDIATNFPETKEGKHSLFMVAFTYDEQLKDKDKAIDSYKAFLQKYPEDKDPNDKLSESAKIMLQNLQSGTSVEDMINKKINESAGDNKTDTTKKEIKKLTPETKEGDSKKPGSTDDKTPETKKPPKETHPETK